MKNLNLARKKRFNHCSSYHFNHLPHYSELEDLTSDTHLSRIIWNHFRNMRSLNKTFVTKANFHQTQWWAEKKTFCSLKGKWNCSCGTDLRSSIANIVFVNITVDWIDILCTVSCCLHSLSVLIVLKLSRIYFKTVCMVEIPSGNIY